MAEAVGAVLSIRTLASSCVSLIETNSDLFRNYPNFDQIKEDLSRLQAFMTIIGDVHREADTLRGTQIESVLQNIGILLREVETMISQKRKSRIVAVFTRLKDSQEIDRLHAKLSHCIHQLSLTLQLASVRSKLKAEGSLREIASRSTLTSSAATDLLTNAHVIRRKAADPEIAVYDRTGKSSNVVSEGRSSTSSHDRAQIIEWLCGIDSELRLADLSVVRIPGSGKWLTNSAAWLDFTSGSGEPALCITGKPGSGKSTIMSLAVENLRAQVRDRHGEAVIFYFFDFRGRATPRDLMASLLRQLCYHDVPLPKFLQQRWEEAKQRTTETEMSEEMDGTLSIQEMMSDFASLLPWFKRIYVCLDGLDECADLKGLIVILRRLVASSCCLCITSRPIREVLDLLEDAPRINITDFTKDDIAAVIEDKFSKLELVSRQDTSVARDRLLTLAQGSFLTTLLQIEELSKQTTNYDFADSLKTLPSDLEDIYLMALDRITQQRTSRAKLARRLVIWIAYAHRPLTLTELQQAVTINPCDNNGDVDDIETVNDPKRLSSPDLIEEVCMGLISVNAAMNKVGPAHATLMHHIQYFRTQLFPYGQKIIAQCLVSFLQHGVFATPIQNLNDYETRLDRFPFLKYAAQHWGTHFREYWHECIPWKVAELMSRSREPLSQMLHLSQDFDHQQSFDYPRNFSDLHMRVYFNLPLLKNPKVGTVIDSWKRSIIHIACQNAYEPTRPTKPLLEDSDWQPETQSSSRSPNKRHRSPQVEDSVAQDGLLLSRIQTLEKLLELRVDIHLKDRRSKTALHYAVTIGSLEMTTLLLKQGAEVHESDASSKTALDYAAENGYVDIVNEILFWYPLPENAHQYRRSNALVSAASNGHDDIVRRLLRCGYYTGIGESFLEAAKNGFLRIVRYLYRAGADISFADDTGMTALHYAASTASLEVASFLLEGYADVNCRDHEHRTPLWFASGAGDGRIFELLCSSGADVDARDIHGQSALKEAAANGHSEIVRLLIAKFPNARFWTWFPQADRMPMLELGSETSEMLTPLQIASKKGFDKVVEILLERVNPDEGAATSRTPLSYAAENGNLRIVEILLTTNRVNINAQDRLGLTPLSHAVRRVHMSIAEILLSDDDVDIHSADKRGRTALSYAAEYGTAEIVKRLLDCGAVQDSVDITGKSVKHYAASNPDPNVSALLKQSEASTIVTEHSPRLINHKSNQTIVMGNVNYFYDVHNSHDVHGMNDSHMHPRNRIIEASPIRESTVISIADDIQELIVKAHDSLSLDEVDDANVRQKSSSIADRLTRARIEVRALQTSQDIGLPSGADDVVTALLGDLEMKLNFVDRKLRRLRRAHQQSKSRESRTSIASYALKIGEELDIVSRDLDVTLHGLDPAAFLVQHSVLNQDLKHVQPGLRPRHRDRRGSFRYIVVDPPSSGDASHTLQKSLHSETMIAESFINAEILAIGEREQIPYSTLSMVTIDSSPRYIVCVKKCGSRQEFMTMKRHLQESMRAIDSVGPMTSHFLKFVGAVRSGRNLDSAETTIDLVYDFPASNLEICSLREVLMKGGRISIDQRLQIPRDLAKSMSYCHSLGMVYRTITPESVLAEVDHDKTRSFSLLFGSLEAPEVSSQPPPTNTSKVTDLIKTLVYGPISEHVVGPVTFAALRDDVYSLGVCLLEVGLGMSFIDYNDQSPSLSPRFKDPLFAGSMGKKSLTAPATRLKMKDILLRMTETELLKRMGPRYAKVVTRCLTCFDDDNEIFRDISQDTDEEKITSRMLFIKHVICQLNEISV